MKKGVLGKQEIKEIFSSIISDPEYGSRIWIPAIIDGRVELQQFSSGQEIIYDFKNFLKAPKGIFFPQREILCSFTENGAQEVPLETQRIIVFGIRPCDARSLLYLDKIFSAGTGGFADPYYLSRRENSVIIALACSAPGEGCFCTSLGGGPGDGKGTDILAFNLEDRLLLESYSAKGESFIEELSVKLRHPSEEDEIAREKLLRAAVSSIPEIRTDGLRDRLESEPGERFWEEVTASCLGCGVCTYLCPTCHCFNIIDETDRGGTGIRVRTWDSCQYPLFTRQASGHNPRADKNQRMKQRMMHKFSYTPQTTGDVFCVGCGRCVRKCPVNLDIREVISRINGDKR